MPFASNGRNKISQSAPDTALLVIEADNHVIPAQVIGGKRCRFIFRFSIFVFLLRKYAGGLAPVGAAQRCCGAREILVYGIGRKAELNRNLFRAFILRDKPKALPLRIA
ncbi:MAG: hypothetical protein R3E11_09975 [Sphingobium sp.]